jgi:multidrug resistance efflux pump
MTDETWQRRLRRRSGTAVLPLMATGLFVFAMVSIVEPERTRAAPPVPPPATGYGSTIAGIGIVEPESEPVAIASELAGVVRSVEVVPGQVVKAGTVLFRLDDRALSAALDSASAEARSALAEQRVAEAALPVARAGLADVEARLALYGAVDDARAVSGDEVERQRFAVERARAALAQASAQAEAARSRAEHADARVRSVRTDLDRLQVRSPIDGRVWRRNVRPGEFAPAGITPEPLMVLGSDRVLQVRVEIDEVDAGRLRAGARAEGLFRGEPGLRIPLVFTRIEPQLRARRALSGAAQRVDSRVVEVLYRFEPAGAGDAPLLIGQRMDVFIEADAGRRR